ncbi:hypothetical protein [Crossiella cryophila]|uniref:Uncharacterized protein n=1 Tax=Crossiella cryophila TaxID=43355 RepID=A0A7W7C774_9PSEU|nr:hypothetical protein [Crossiella cryophila]MBB4675793.1 hypothetical protein [Crossiella cryophila]
MTTQPQQFPGRWLGGISLVLGPALLLAGVLTRFGVYFFFPAQLAGYAAEPLRLTVSYSLVAAGLVLLCPAVLALSARIGNAWGAFGTAFVLIGLFARVFHAGVDHLAFRLVDSRQSAVATEVVAAGYGVPHVFSVTAAAAVFGWPLLAFGAYRAGVFGPLGGLALAAMAALPVGVLKGSTISSVVAAAALCLALVPLGVRVLRTGGRPDRAGMVKFAAVVVGAAGLGWLSTMG